MDIIRGKVWKFDDNINTDLLMPAQSGNLREEERKYYCMVAVRPDFAKEVRKGDIVIAGKNFGCGSSRPAAKNLLALGIGCVLADSMGAIFFRNAINLGLPVFSLEGISSRFEEGDEAEVNLKIGEVKKIGSREVLKIPPVPEQIMNILESGGIYRFLKMEAKAGRLYQSAFEK